MLYHDNSEINIGDNVLYTYKETLQIYSGVVIGFTKKCVKLQAGTMVIKKSPFYLIKL